MKNNSNQKSKKYLRGFIKLILALVVLSGAARADNDVTFYVTDAQDSGAGSLREAINYINNITPPVDYTHYIIKFQIPGGGIVHTINLQSPLPAINLQNSDCQQVQITLDASAMATNTGEPRVVINGVNAGANADGIKIIGGYLNVKGLAINRFSGWGINVQQPDNPPLGCGNPQWWGVYTGLNLQSSRIGTDVTGSQDLGNGAGGVRLKSTYDSFIGTTYGGRNVISGNGGDGVLTELGNITFENNRIGTNFNGTAAIPNGGNGIKVMNHSYAEIGNPVDANIHNIISGNAGHGIYVEHSDFRVRNSFIGTDATSNTAIGNGGSGVYVHSGYEAITEKIGGSSVNEGNVISGNAQNGIYCDPETILIQGNRIGTNLLGTVAVGNQQHGIRVAPHATVSIKIGGQAGTAAGNLISGNAGDGIRFAKIRQPNQNTETSFIEGNLIGVNSSATAAIPNGGSGISVLGDANETIFNSTIAWIIDNVIGGNASHGITLNGTAKEIGIKNNYIGTRAGGADLGNGGNGVYVLSDARENEIVQNTIAYNNGDAVYLQPGFGGNTYPDDITIRQNSMYENSESGIDLGPTDGVTPNDTKDFDNGANDLQNFPVLQAASQAAVNGTLHSAPNSKFIIDIYRVNGCDANGYGEGRFYVGSVETTTNGQGNANFNATNLNLSLGQTITATATQSTPNDYYESTSEFSPCLVVNETPGAFSLSTTAYAVNEGAGTVTITVKRTSGSNTVTVDYATSDGTAIAGQDYTPTSGTLTFAPGASNKTFTVPITNDTTNEPLQTFDVTLSNPTGAAQIVSPSSAEVTIGDNDNPPTVSINDYSHAEGNQNTTAFTFNVSLSEASAIPASVNWATADVTANAPSDYQAAGGTLNFAVGETLKQITVQVNGDLSVETNETFVVNLSSPVQLTVGDGKGVGTIMDDDNPGKFSFSQAPYNANENVGTKNVTVIRTNGSVGTATVDLTTVTGGTATAGQDYAATSATLVFLDGETTKVFPITILDDQIEEQTETINLTLSNPTSSATLGASSAILNILDDDAAPTTVISGIVNYAITPLNQSQKKVPDVLLSAEGSNNGSATTDDGGAYQINNLTAGGQYNVTATKSGHINGITAFDATLVLRHVAANGQGANGLSVNQQKAADTDGDSNVTAFDATQILRFVAANGQNASTGQTGNWKFLPATKTYQSLGNSLSGEDYEAVLVGEVDGDWMSPSSNSLANSENENAAAVGEKSESAENSGLNADAEISMPVEISEENGEKTLIVPVLLTNYSGRTVSAYNFDLRFDPNVLQLEAQMAVDTAETLSQGMTLVHSQSKSGRIGIAAAGGILNDNSKRSGVLLKLRFKIVGTPSEKAGGETALTFRQTPIFQDNEGALIKVKRNGGSIRVISGGTNESVKQ